MDKIINLERNPLYPYLKKMLKSKRIILFSVLTGLILIIPGLFMPLFSKLFIDEVIMHDKKDWLFPLIGGMLLTTIVYGQLIWLLEFHLLKFKIKLSISTKSKFIYNILHLPDQIFTKTSRINYLRRIKACENLSKFLANDFIYALINLITSLFFLIIMFLFSKVLAIIALLLAIFKLFVLYNSDKKRVFHSLNLKKCRNRLINFSDYIIANINNIYLKSLSKHVFSRRSGLYSRAFKEEGELYEITHMAQTLSIFSYELSHISVIIIGALLIIRGSISVGTLVAFQSLMANFLNPLNNLFEFGLKYHDAKSDALYLEKILTNNNSINIDEKSNIKNNSNQQKSHDMPKMNNNNKKVSRVIKENIDEDPIVICTRLIFSKLEIDIPIEPVNLKSSEPEEKLHELFHKWNYHFRKVHLKHSWFKEDNGPLLGFYNNKPVAFIPVSESKYLMHDPINNNKIIVTKNIINDISQIGYMFYKELPDNIIKFKDILKFGFHSLWKRDIFKLIGVNIAMALISITIPIAISILFNSIIPESQYGQVFFIALFLFAGVVSGTLFHMANSIFSTRIQWKMDSSLDAAIWSKILKTHESFYRKFPVAELSDNILNLSEILSKLSIKLVSLVTAITSLIVNICLMIYFDIKLSIVSLSLTIFILIIYIIFGYLRLNYFKLSIKQNSKISGLLYQIGNEFDTDKSQEFTNKSFHKWEQEELKQKKSYFKAEKYTLYINTFTQSLPLISLAIIFYIYSTINFQELALGNFVAFNSAFSAFLSNSILLSLSMIGLLELYVFYDLGKPLLEYKSN